MNVRSWLKNAKKDIDSLDAELILGFVLEKDRPYLVSHDDYELEPNEEEAADDLVFARKNHYPLAYLTGVKEFYGREFNVNENVLIPRPETETIIDILKELKPTSMIDIGTGSGCIAITAKLEMPDLKVIASDLSDSALIVARENCEKLECELDDIRKADLLEQDITNIDTIVANLPYVNKDWDFLSPEIKNEPDSALYADDNGLSLIKKLLNQVVEKDFKGNIILESDNSQQKDIIEFAEKLGISHITTQGFITVLKNA